ncbi:hypothetical protein [Methylocella sp.]|uniref:hypothetical protein n=1 Tax=Methylocella sp. TaxID=1978226 RepID=UPI003783A64B
MTAARTIGRRLGGLAAFCAATLALAGAPARALDFGEGFPALVFDGDAEVRLARKPAPPRRRAPAPRRLRQADARPPEAPEARAPCVTSLACPGAIILGVGF